MEKKKLTAANGRPIADNQNSQTAGPSSVLLLDKSSAKLFTRQIDNFNPWIGDIYFYQRYQFYLDLQCFVGKNIRCK